MSEKKQKLSDLKLKLDELKIDSFIIKNISTLGGSRQDEGRPKPEGPKPISDPWSYPMICN